MFNRHGQKDFSSKDYALTRQIKQHTQLILDNLAVTNDYCECILHIFDIINILKLELTDIEFYKKCNLPIDFRKFEYEDNCKRAYENLEQFRNYRENKRMAFATLEIQKNKNKIKLNETTNEKKITMELKNLAESIKKIASKINENTSLSQPVSKVFLSKENQIRKLQLQNTVISKERERIPISYKRNEPRKSQSIPYLNSIYISKLKDLRFFTSTSQNNTEEEKIYISSNMSNRRMSL